MKYNFKELIDVPKLQELTDELYMAASIASAIVTMDGEVLTGSGWQRLCTDFHRQHPEIEKDCIESDTKIRKQLDDGEPFAIYKCPRGLVDASSPVIIAGEHVANVFAGQIFLEPPDKTTEQFFREQALKFGFDETEYMKAFKEIPIFTENKFRAAISFLAKLAQMTADMGLTRLNELESMEALRNSEKKFRSLFESINDSLFVHLLTEDDLPGHFIEVNDMACKKLGYSRQELLQLTPRDISAPDDGMNPVEIGNKLLAHGSTLFETMHLTKDGQPMPVESNIQLFDYDGQRAVLSIARDITDRKQAEKALRENNARHSSMIANIGDVIGITGADGIMKYISPNIERWFGWKPEDLIGTRSWKRVHPDGIKRIKKEFYAGIENENDSVTVEYRYKCKDGTYKWIELTAVNRINDTTINGILLNYHDISERKQAYVERVKLQAQLTQSQKMESIGTLAGGIAHDFNNILFPILGHSEMLLEDVPENSQSRSSLKEIYTAALRAKDLVKQILTFSRQDRNELQLMKMQPVIKEALKLIRSTIPATIYIKQDIQADCGVIKADPTQIHQIIMNLATNAYHAMEETGGELNIKLKKVEFGELDLFNPDTKSLTYVRLSISDTGKGMEKSLTDKIFDPFFTTKEIGKGTGMGLSVVHGIVSGMNGTIKINSELGKGTQFHVYLPLAEAVKEQQVTKVAAASILGGTEHILLVDDEKAILTMEKRLLERLGYHVTSRSSSLEALEAFRATTGKFDLVITDMAMPNMPGDKLAGELTKIRPDIPVLLCTGFSETMSEEKAESLGINGFLLKPIIMKDLAQKVREVLGDK